MKKTPTLAAGIATLSLVASAAGALAQPPEREPVSIAQFDRWMDELSNWGRWGDDDQIGAANLMTDAKRREAAALVRTGTTVSLSHDFLTEEAVDAAEPYVLQMNVNPEGQNSGDRVEGADSVHEAPDSVPGLRVNPIHRFAIVARGMNLLDNIDLDAAAATAARLNRWEFMLVVAPLRVPGGTGSPVNPIAIF